MSSKEIVEKIKSRGYWRINFQPLVNSQKLKKVSDCKDIVEKNNVSLRGWDYPHFPSRTNELGLGKNFCQGWIDWGFLKEFWRMYQSGQFVNYLALREDWFDVDDWYGERTKSIIHGSCLEIIWTVYQITEIYEFLSRLANKGIYDEGVNVIIALNNTTNRKLWIINPSRAPLSYDRVNPMETIELPPKQYNKDEIITKSKELALEMIIEIFTRFNWDNPPIETIKEDQNNLLQKKL